MPNTDFHSYFYYDETSLSCLRWKTNRYWGKNNNQLIVAAGDPVGWISPKGYWMTELSHKQLRVHNIIWILFNGTVFGVVDHLNGDTLNNQLNNLADKSGTENRRNVKKHKINTSGFTGVKWDNKQCAARPKPSWYAVAFWNDLQGKQKCKSFSVKVYGLLPAFAKAVEYRSEQIRLLNSQGAGYTKRHGT